MVMYLLDAQRSYVDAPHQRVWACFLSGTVGNGCQSIMRVVDAHASWEVCHPTVKSDDQSQ